MAQSIAAGSERCRSATGKNPCEPVRIGVFKGKEEAGLALFQEKNCVACHQFYGLGGYMGPDLTNVISAPDKGPDYARAFIESGSAKMPDFGFSEAQVDDLVRFLEFVDASGRYRPELAEISWNGTVDYDAGRDRQ